MWQEHFDDSNPSSLLRLPNELLDAIFFETLCTDRFSNFVKLRRVNSFFAETIIDVIFRSDMLRSDVFQASEMPDHLFVRYMKDRIVSGDQYRKSEFSIITKAVAKYLSNADTRNTSAETDQERYAHYVLMLCEAFVTNPMASLRPRSQVLYRNVPAQVEEDKIHQTVVAGAAFTGNLLLLEDLLNPRNSPAGGFQSPYHGSALDAAARAGHVEALKLILSKSSISYDAFVAAHRVACLRGHEAIVQTLYETQIRLPAHDLQRSILKAADGGHQHVIRLLFDSTPKAAIKCLHPDIQNRILFNACRHGHVHVAEAAINTTLADLNCMARFENWYCPIQIASRHGHEQVVRLLCSRGAQVNVRGRKFHPIILAASAGHTKVVQALLDNGVDINHGNGLVSPLISAAKFGQPEMVFFLLKNGLDPHFASGQRGRCAGKQAASRGYLSVVKFLAAEGVNLDSMMAEAEYYNQVHVVQCLRGVKDRHSMISDVQ